MRNNELCGNNELMTKRNNELIRCERHESYAFARLFACQMIKLRHLSTPQAEDLLHPVKNWTKTSHYMDRQIFLTRGIYSYIP